MTMPFYGPYNASKWALEALAENYRSELSQFGVESCIIEPGGYPTTFMTNLMKPSDRSRDAEYGEMARAPETTLQGFHQLLEDTPAQDPANVAKAMADLVAAERGKRPFRTVVDALGMGDAIAPYNDQLEQTTKAIYGHMNIGHLLEITE
jgi:NAD(P)-dependent dehydrogenase (short-subunit alcohol dehydrogenase family)